MTETTTTEPVLVTQKRPVLAWILLTCMALVWGSSFIMMKKALGAFTVQQVASGRIFFAFLFFIPFLVVQARQPDVQVVLRRRWLALLASGVLGFLLPAFLFAEAGAHLSSSLSGTLNSLSPLFVLLTGTLLFRQQFRANQVWGILLGLVGSLILVFFSATGSFTVNGYAFLVVLATVMYGINTNLIGKYLSHLPALVAPPWTFAFVGPIAGIFLLSTDFVSRAVAADALVPMGAVLFLGIMASGITSVLFIRVVQLASGVFAASVTYLIPVVAVVWGLFDEETIYPQQYLGLTISLLGIYLVNRQK
ncbi:DMT family transporter [Fibrella forsythiae]|uniref:DMT family transporter n=1 Tax=Fibrella forsythiae TaxID=2817061 RepID=A0ABS3JNN7_9BACT|nr:DMT family transporter [Fibrella forsythiae]MBO0951604.1 DMT family transporter [Fibrella forsythiae]